MAVNFKPLSVRADIHTLSVLVRVGTPAVFLPQCEVRSVKVRQGEATSER